MKASTSHRHTGGAAEKSKFRNNFSDTSCLYVGPKEMTVSLQTLKLEDRPEQSSDEQQVLWRERNMTRISGSKDMLKLSAFKMTIINTMIDFLISFDGIFMSKYSTETKSSQG